MAGGNIKKNLSLFIYLFQSSFIIFFFSFCTFFLPFFHSTFLSYFIFIYFFLHVEHRSWNHFGIPPPTPTPKVTWKMSKIKTVWSFKMLRLVYNTINFTGPFHNLFFSSHWNMYQTCLVIFRLKLYNNA